MRPDGDVPRFNDEHVVDHIGGGARLADEGQCANDDVVAVDDAFGRVGVHDGLDVTVAQGAHTVLAPDFVLQGLERQVYLQGLAKPHLAAL
ncbi:hypothetical protein D3C87_1726380 [compost metagenome]